MDRIPSALERALERVEKLGRASAEDLERSRLKEEGQKLAALYLNGEANLRSELNNYEDGPERAGLAEGIEEVLIRNLALPTTDLAKDRNRLAMDGLKLTKKDPGAVENIFSKMRQVFNHYTGQGEMQRKEALENLKRDMQMLCHRWPDSRACPQSTCSTLRGTRSSRWSGERPGPNWKRSTNST